MTGNQCKKKTGGYAESLCDFMQSISTIGAGGKAKGLFTHNMVNVNSGEKLGVGVSIRTAERPHGVFLNYCPFCGGELRDQERDA